MTKAECRKIFASKRKSLTNAEIEIQSTHILSLLTTSFDLKNKTISLFLPIAAKQEINTFPLLQLTEKLTIRFVLPVSDFSSNTLKHIVYEEDEQLQLNDYGIPEPTYGQSIPINEIDIVIVPLLCFDKRGYRTGYGKGFYDRFLASCKPNCLFIGLSYFEPIDRIDDVTNNDIALHHCVTPKELYSFV